MTQEIIIYIIIAAAAAIAIRWAVRTVRNASKANSSCAGCPIAEACSSKNKNKCPNDRTKTEKNTLKICLIE